MMNTLGIKYTAQSGLFDAISLTAAAQYFRESRHDRRLNDDWLRNRIEKVQAWSVNLDLDKKISPSLTLYYGAEAVFNKVASTGMRRHIDHHEEQAIASRYPDGATWQSGAAYVNANLALGHKVNLMGGLRYNGIRMRAALNKDFFDFSFERIDIDNAAWSASLGMAYRPSRHWKLSLNLASGFRAPNIDDAAKVFDSEPGNVVVPNPDLKPEYAYNIDMGLAYAWKDQGRIEVGAFHVVLDQGMLRRPFSFQGRDSILYDGEMSAVRALVNAEQIRVYGAYVSLAYPLAAAWTLKGGVNLALGQTDEGLPVRHVPPTYGDLRLQYQQKNWKVLGYAIFNGALSYQKLAPSEREKPYLYAMDKDGKPFSPSWLSLHLKIRRQMTSFVYLEVGLDNALDSRYRTYSSGVIAPGRNFIITLRTQF